eukprot:scaffold15028_cov100-Isochrysis_galbana.AAC.5
MSEAAFITAKSHRHAVSGKVSYPEDRAQCVVWVLGMAALRREGNGLTIRVHHRRVHAGCVFREPRWSHGARVQRDRPAWTSPPCPRNPSGIPTLEHRE